MWFGEPHPFLGKRITYQIERVRDNEVTKGDLAEWVGCIYNFFPFENVINLPKECMRAPNFHVSRMG